MKKKDLSGWLLPWEDYFKPGGDICVTEVLMLPVKQHKFNTTAHISASPKNEAVFNKSNTKESGIYWWNIKTI